MEDANDAGTWDKVSQLERESLQDMLLCWHHVADKSASDEKGTGPFIDGEAEHVYHVSTLGATRHKGDRYI